MKRFLMFITEGLRFICGRYDSKRPHVHEWYLITERGINVVYHTRDPRYHLFKGYWKCSCGATKELDIKDLK